MTPSQIQHKSNTFSLCLHKVVAIISAKEQYFMLITCYLPSHLRCLHYKSDIFYTILKILLRKLKSLIALIPHHSPYTGVIAFRIDVLKLEITSVWRVKDLSFSVAVMIMVESVPLSAGSRPASQYWF